MKKFNKLMFLSIVMIGGASSMLSARDMNDMVTVMNETGQNIYLQNKIADDALTGKKGTFIQIATLLGSKSLVGLEDNDTLYYRFVSSNNEPLVVENVTRDTSGVFQRKDIKGDTINVK